MTPTEPARSRQTRIPFTLQAVFLASNRGKDVHKPPPGQAANKVFLSNWFLQRQPDAHNSKSVKNLSKRSIHEADKKKEEEENERSTVMSPQAYLDIMLRTRGYSTKRYETLKSAYYSKPTPLQKSSYDIYLIGLVRKDDLETFREVMSCGLSPNPCNQFGASIAHMVARTGKKEFLEVLVEKGASLSIADDYGRTPLHDACWAAEPAFEMVQVILKSDLRLFHMIDARGHVPLNYVREEHWGEWIQFLESNKTDLWPEDADSEEKQKPPPLALLKPNTCPLPDPPNALTPETAKMVATNRMTPKEVQMLFPDKEEDNITEDLTENYGDDDLSSSDYESDCDDDDSYNSDFAEDEMAELLAGLPSISLTFNNHH